jgi:hypothetical protein
LNGPGRRGQLGKRLILASRVVERIYGRLDRIRSTAILGLASDAALDLYNKHVYEGADRYRPDSEAFVGVLYPWEEAAIRNHFPPPPAHLLIGGAGAGREPLALATIGYRVTAFEPVPALAASMDQTARARGLADVATYVAGYQNLPALTSLDGTRETLSTLGPFDGAVIGWGSFSHLRSEAARVETLRQMSAETHGPVLVSFISVRLEGPSDSGKLRSRLLRRRGRHSSDRFSMTMGFHHPVNQEEVRRLADAAGLEVVAIDFSAASLAPHAVLHSR